MMRSGRMHFINDNSDGMNGNTNYQNSIWSGKCTTRSVFICKSGTYLDLFAEFHFHQ